MRAIRIETKFLYSNLTPGGIDPGALEAFWPKAQRALWELQTRRAKGDLPFLDLPYSRDMDRVLEGSGDLQGFDPVVVLGIGGSSLGPQAVAHVLFHPWMALESRARPEGPRVYFLDNIDPATCHRALEAAREGNPLVIAISKSGTTLETLSQLILFLKALRDCFRDWKDRLLIITDPQKGPMRALAEEEGLRSFPIPEGVPGRYSVLSAVGIVPLQAMGVRGEELLLGATEMDRDIRQGEGRPVLETASALYLLHKGQGKGTWVTFCYGDSLLKLAEWRAQLVAESLGKRRDRAPLPVSARGTTDQHSQLQLWLDGPKDKAFTFLSLKGHHPLPIPEGEIKGEEAEALGGKDLGEVLEAERRATEYVLAERGCPFYRVELEPTPRAIGALLFFWEVETLLLGSFYEVNPLDQPAVERGKRLAWGLLGRRGFEEEKKEIEGWGR